MMWKPIDAEINELRPLYLSQKSGQEIFARLYEAYVEGIYRYIYFRVGDDQLAEDITSQVFLKAWKKLDTYQAGQSCFKAWLYRIAHNAVIDHYRTRKTTVPFNEANTLKFSHGDEVNEKLDLQIESQELREALRVLTERQQQVLTLKFLNGLSTAEIAQQLGKQEGAVRSLQMRGLHKLAKSFFLQKARFYK